MRLGLVLKKYRLMMEFDLRGLASEIGISAATLMRIEHGRVPDLETWTKIQTWLLSKYRARRVVEET